MASTRPDDWDCHDQDAAENIEDFHRLRRQLNFRPMAPLIEGVQEVVLKAEAAAMEGEGTWSPSAAYLGSHLGAKLEALQEPFIAEYGRL